MNNKSSSKRYSGCRATGRIRPFMTPIALLLATVLLVGCNSKPGDGDIAKELSEMYQCPLLEVADTKKQDGAEYGNKQYQVAYSFTVNVKGGEKAAAKLFSQWITLTEQLSEAKAQAWRVRDAAARSLAAGSSGTISNGSLSDIPAVRQAQLVKEQLESQVQDVFPCSGMETLSAFQTMVLAVKENLTTGTPKIPVPVAIRMSGGAVMGKTEMGWHFAGMPNQRPVEVIQSDPVAFAAPQKRVAQVASDNAALP